MIGRVNGDSGKVAVRLRAGTAMALDWIAEALNMGTAGSLGNLLLKKK